MRTIEPHIQNYIDESVERAAEEAAIRAETRFSVRTERYMKDLRDGFKQDIKMGFESIDLHIKETIRQELRPMQDTFDNHTIRITKLELKKA